MENQPISPWKHFTTCLTTKYCCFEGRATRAECWSYLLFYILVFRLPLQAIASSNPHSTVPSILNIIVNIALILPTLGVFARRMHDSGRSGWNCLWLLHPFSVLIILLLLCQDSGHGPNKYGPSEKYPQALVSTNKQSITLWDRFTTCLSTKYCCFEGRATRAEYWGYILYNFLLFGLPLGVINYAISAKDPYSSTPSVLILLTGLAFLLPGLGLSVRRLHDTGRSGWYCLLFLIPIIGQIIQLVFACEDSNHGPNMYGSSEKYPLPSDTACNYCPKCGAKLPPDAYFCTNCGSRLV